MEDYSRIKVIAWRFGRVFVSAFLIEAAIYLPQIETLDLNIIYKLLIIPSLIAGLNALGKAIREFKGSEDYTKLVNKIPV